MLLFDGKISNLQLSVFHHGIEAHTLAVNGGHSDALFTSCTHNLAMQSCMPQSYSSQPGLPSQVVLN